MTAFEVAVAYVVIVACVVAVISAYLWATQPEQRETLLDEHYREFEKWEK